MAGSDGAVQVSKPACAPLRTVSADDVCGAGAPGAAGAAGVAAANGGRPGGVGSVAGEAAGYGFTLPATDIGAGLGDGLGAATGTFTLARARGSGTGVATRARCGTIRWTLARTCSIVAGSDP